MTPYARGILVVGLGGLISQMGVRTAAAGGAIKLSAVPESVPVTS